jgi:hypothetical protein
MNEYSLYSQNELMDVDGEASLAMVGLAKGKSVRKALETRYEPDQLRDLGRGYFYLADRPYIVVTAVKHPSVKSGEGGNTEDTPEGVVQPVQDSLSTLSQQGGIGLV